MNKDNQWHIGVLFVYVLLAIFCLIVLWQGPIPIIRIIVLPKYSLGGWSGLTSSSIRKLEVISEWGR